MRARRRTTSSARGSTRIAWRRRRNATRFLRKNDLGPAVSAPGSTQGSSSVPAARARFERKIGSPVFTGRSGGKPRSWPPAKTLDHRRGAQDQRFPGSGLLERASSPRCRGRLFARRARRQGGRRSGKGQSLLGAARLCLEAGRRSSGAFGLTAHPAFTWARAAVKLYEAPPPSPLAQPSAARNLRRRDATSASRETPRRAQNPWRRRALRRTRILPA